MAHLTRDKVVGEWLVEAEAAVRAAQEVVEAAERELQAALVRLERLQAAREVAEQADAVVREHAGDAPKVAPAAGAAVNAPVPVWRPDLDPGRLPREYPRIVEIVRQAGPEGIRAVEVHRLLDGPDTDAARQTVRNRLQRLAQKGWLRLVRRGVYALAADA